MIMIFGIGFAFIMLNKGIGSTFFKMQEAEIYKMLNIRKIKDELSEEELRKSTILNLKDNVEFKKFEEKRK